jgi:hypothetical protein
MARGVTCGGEERSMDSRLREFIRFVLFVGGGLFVLAVVGGSLGVW